MNASEQVEKLYNKIQASCNETLADFKYRYLTDSLETKKETLKGFILSFIEFGEDVNSCTALIHLNRQKHPQRMFGFMEVMYSHLTLIDDYYFRIIDLTGYDTALKLFKKQGNFEVDKSCMLYWEFQRKLLNQSESLPKVISGLRIIETCDWLDSERQSVQAAAGEADNSLSNLDRIKFELSKCQIKKGYDKNLLSDLISSPIGKIRYDSKKHGAKNQPKPLRATLKKNGVPAEIYKSISRKVDFILIDTKNILL